MSASDTKINATSAGIPSKLTTIHKKWREIRYKLRKPFAEFLGTGVMIAFGCGAVAQNVFSTDSTYWNVSYCWGIAVTIGIYISAGISGAHLNPAVTLALAIYRGLPWIEVPVYWLAQFLGAFCGALTVYITNCSYFKDTDRESTLGIFFTSRSTSHVTTTDAFVFELYATALLIIIIFATTDNHNHPAGIVQPLIMGLSITLIGNTFGFQTGYALNPARDLGPRFFTAISGWGFSVFSRQDYYFWVPIVSPLVGAVCGGGIYDLLIHSKDHTHTQDHTDSKEHTHKPGEV
ncbi:hypothetical protein BGX27_000497 [Mortierella sp. AM989]|nr:hypothetical protein BGX27_000497 [Mortierella sp. AM989]